MNNAEGNKVFGLAFNTDVNEGWWPCVWVVLSRKANIILYLGDCFHNIQPIADGRSLGQGR